MSNDCPVYIYFHICTINNWQDIVSKLYASIRASGLFDVIQKMYLVVLGSESDIPLVKALFNSDKVIIAYHSTDLKIYERKCLLLMREHALREKCKMLYIHSKGVSKNPKSVPIIDWVNIMVYFNITQYKRCLEVLNEYDCCGININTITVADLRHTSWSKDAIAKSYHFSGNFWWATSDCIQKLPDTIGPKYIDAELWINSEIPKKMYSFWQTNANHYRVEYPESLYTDKEQQYIIDTN